MSAREISDAAVQKATGHDWAEWLKLLDKAGAKKMSHQEIVAVAAQHGAGRWWQQMVTVTYEQKRGLREVHQQSGGFTATVERGLPARSRRASRSAAGRRPGRDARAVRPGRPRSSKGSR